MVYVLNPIVLEHGTNYKTRVAGGTQCEIVHPITPFITGDPPNFRRTSTRPLPLRSSKTSSGEAPEIVGAQ
jgi:hypothetical protein